MRNRNAPMVWLVACAVCILALTLSTSLWAETPKRGGTLVYVVPSSGLPSFDAHRETTFAMIHPVAPFYSLLVRVDPNDSKGLKIEGDAAESWTVSKDQKVFTFKLRSGIKFHDGSPMVAQDVVATFNKIIFPPKGVLSSRKGYFLMVDSISAPDAKTVVFKLKFGTPAFMPALAMPYNFLYQASQLKKDIHWYEKNVNGSGPFKMKDFSPGGTMTGVRNDNYFKAGLPYLDGFEAIFSKKQAIQVAAIRSGRALANFRGFPPKTRDDIIRSLGKDNVTVQESPWNCALFVVPNSHKKPFDNPKVRRALSLSVDRWGGSKYLSKIAIVKTVGGYVFPGHPLAMSESELVKLDGFGRDVNANRAKARKLLKEAGIPDGFKFVFHNRAVEMPYKIVGTWLIDQWRQVGLNVEQWVQPTAQFYKTLRSNPPGFEVSMDFNCQSIVNPTLDISKFISWDKSGANNGKYIDRELDKMYETQMKETDPIKQKAILDKFQERLVDQGWYSITLWWHRIIPHNAKLRGWNITPSHYLNMQLEPVWLAN